MRIDTARTRCARWFSGQCHASGERDSPCMHWIGWAAPRGRKSFFFPEIKPCASIPILTEQLRSTACITVFNFPIQRAICQSSNVVPSDVTGIYRGFGGVDCFHHRFVRDYTLQHVGLHTFHRENVKFQQFLFFLNSQVFKFCL
jgi:hypothetical protein